MVFRQSAKLNKSAWASWSSLRRLLLRLKNSLECVMIPSVPTIQTAAESWGPGTVPQITKGTPSAYPMRIMSE